MTTKLLSKEKKTKATIMLLSFFLAKLAAFLGPFWIANNSSTEFYGSLELYLSLGIWSAMLIGLGIPGSIPVQIIKHKNTNINNLCLFFILISAIVALTVMLIIDFSAQSKIAVLLPGIVFFSLAQQITSPLIKSYKVSPVSPWLDNLALHVVVTSYITAYVFYHSNTDEATTKILMLVTVAAFFLCMAMTTKKNSNKTSTLFITYKDCVKIGFPILLNGLVMMFIFNSGRILIGFINEEKEVALYSYMFRIAGIGLILYQFFSIIFFRKIYESNSKKTSRKITILFGIIAAESYISYFILVTFGSRFVPEDILKQGAINLFPLIATQVNIWILSAILETRINARGVTSRSARLCLLPSGLLVISFFFMNIYAQSSVFFACLCLMLSGLIATLIQTHVINFKNNDPLKILTPTLLACSPLILLSGGLI